jgi:protein-S-isoprenylcysteine O-methyltransferase Ste14
MSLREEIEKQGDWLFQWRSYLPLVFAPAFAIALYNYRWPFAEYQDYQIWAKLCFGISLIGLAVRCLTVGYTPAQTSGRDTCGQLAAELNTTGMYSLVRHPLYLGNFLIGSGVCLAPFVWWLPVMYCLIFCSYYERIMLAEEAFLQRSFRKKFAAWSARTPAFFPRHLRWRHPQLKFSFRKVLKREYTGLMVVIICNAAVQLSEHLIVDHRVVYEAFWVTLLICGGVAYFSLKSLKSCTTLLDVPGR